MQDKHPARTRLEGFFGVEGAEKFIQAKTKTEHYKEVLRPRLSWWVRRWLDFRAQRLTAPKLSNAQFVEATEAVEKLFRTQLEKRFSKAEVAKIDSRIAVIEIVNKKMQKSHQN